MTTWRGGGRRAKDIRVTCIGDVKKLTFSDDVISVQPLMGSIKSGWKGLTRKIVPIGRGVCMRLLGGGEEVCKFKFKVVGVWSEFCK